MIGLIHIVIGSFHVCYVYRGALRRLMHTEVCIGLDIAHFPSLMYGFIMQQNPCSHGSSKSSSDKIKRHDFGEEAAVSA